MTNLFSIEHINSRLDELEKQEKNANSEKEELNRQLKDVNTSEEKQLKIIEAVTSVNKVIESIHLERTKMIEFMGKQSKFIIYCILIFLFKSNLFFFFSKKILFMLHQIKKEDVYHHQLVVPNGLLIF